MKTVLITGARGFIAGQFARGLKSAGYRVIGTSRKPGGVPHFDAVYPLSLGQTIQSLIAQEAIDALIHAALDKGLDAYKRNLEGTRRWFSEASRGGVTTQVLLSTLSARPGVTSDYGLAKLGLEECFLEQSAIVLRLGIVIGPGGIYARMVESARRLPLVPLLEGGRQTVGVVGVDALCAVIQQVLDRPGAFSGRRLNLHQPSLHQLKDILRAVVRVHHWRRLFVPVPLKPLLWAMLAFEKLLPVRLPITSENLKGLMATDLGDSPSSFNEFGWPEEGLDVLCHRARCAATESH